MNERDISVEGTRPYRIERERLDGGRSVHIVQLLQSEYENVLNGMGAICNDGITHERASLLGVAADCDACPLCSSRNDGVSICHSQVRSIEPDTIRGLTPTAVFYDETIETATAPILTADMLRGARETMLRSEEEVALQRAARAVRAGELGREVPTGINIVSESIRPSNWITEYVDPHISNTEQEEEEINKPTKPKGDFMAAKPFNTYTLGDMRRLKLAFMKKHASKVEIAEALDKLWVQIVSDIPELCNAPYLRLCCEDGDKEKPILDVDILRKNCIAFLREKPSISNEVSVKSLTLLDSVASIKDIDPQIIYDQEVAKIDESIAGYESRIRDTGDSIAASERYLRQYWEQNRTMGDQINQLEMSKEAIVLADNGTVAPIYSSIKEAINNCSDAWELQFIEPDEIGTSFKLCFLSLEPKTCIESDPLNGIHKEFKAGRCFVLMTCTHGNISEIKVAPYPIPSTYCSPLADYRSDMSGNAWHPHSQSNRYPCFGDIASRANGYMVGMEIGKWLRELDKILAVYNAGSPYVSLSELIRRSKVKHAAATQWQFLVGMGKRFESFDYDYRYTEASVKNGKLARLSNVYYQSLYIASKRGLDDMLLDTLWTREAVAYVITQLTEGEAILGSAIRSLAPDMSLAQAKHIESNAYNLNRRISAIKRLIKFINEGGYHDSNEETTETEEAGTEATTVTATESVSDGNN